MTGLSPAHQRPGGEPPSTVGPREHSVSIPATDGYPLAALVLEPPEPRAVLLLHGGTGIPKEFYQRFARFAAGRGFVVVLSDYRGVGGSRPRSLRGFEAYMRWWGERDMPGVLQWTRDTYPSLPRVLLGHSAGGQLVGLMPNHHELVAVAAIAAGSGYWRGLRAPYRYVTLLIWYGLVPLLTPVFGYFPARRLRLGEDLPAGTIMEWRDWCLHDPYLGARFGQTILRHYYDEVSTPIRAWAFTDDPIAHPASSAAMFKLYTRAPVTIDAVSPQDAGAEIGHLGFFRPSHSETLWPRPLDWLDGELTRAGH
jgi:predicted alpha/beta hydrolase